MRLSRLLLTSVMVVAFALGATTAAYAMEPPRPGEIASLRARGQFPERLAFAHSIGNHRMDRSLATRGRALVQSLQGYQSLPAPPPGGGACLPSSGTQKPLALLISFQDYPATVTQAQMQASLFGSGVATGSTYPMESVKNYYARSSNGALTLSGNTLGWYAAPYNRSTVATTSGGREAVIKEALEYYDSQGHDFTQYDGNGDGEIDYLIVIWTGPEGEWASFWWGYYTDWWATPDLALDGKAVGNYSWQYADLVGTPQTVIHETGHALGLPDYYDYDDTVGPDGGVGGYDMMDGNLGDHNAYSKWMLDWITPTTVNTTALQTTLRSSATYEDALVVMDDSSAGNTFDEFFLVQNRGFDKNDAAWFPYGLAGLTIWHVDGTLSGGDFAFDNSYTAHKLLAVEQADGLSHLENNPAYNSGLVEPADFWKTGQAFEPLSTPSSLRYSGVHSQVYIRDITISGGSASLEAFVAIFDTQAPITSDDADSLWHNTPVTVTFTALDAQSGVDWTRYNVDGSPWEYGDSVVVTAPADGSRDGVHTVQYQSQDESANLEAVRSATVKIDTTAPTSTIAATSVFAGIARVNLAASDAKSGVSAMKWRLDGGGWQTGYTPTFVAVGSHELDYYAVDAAGNSELVHNITFDGPVATTMAMSASAKTVYYGDTTVSGSLKAAGVGVGGKTVKLEYSTDGATWRSSTLTAKTTTSGTYSFTVRPYGKTWYRARFLGDLFHAPQVSGNTVFTVKAVMTAPSSRAYAYVGRTFTSTGYLKPRHSYGSKPVTVRCYHYESGAWVLRRAYAARVVNIYSYSKYYASVSLPMRGRWKLVAYHADAAHAPSTSPARVVTVY